MQTTLSKIQQFLEIVETKIREGNSKGLSVPTIPLSKELAANFGWEWTHAYQLIGIYLCDRADLFIKKGRAGGITPLATPIATSMEIDNEGLTNGEDELE